MPHVLNNIPDITHATLLRRIEDLTNELAYITHFPERAGSPLELAARRLGLLAQIRICRQMLYQR